MYGLLDDVRILDLTSVVLGPLATTLLGDLGADVIKVEPPDGDLFRATSPSRHAGMGAPFMGVNRNKRSIVLDLKQEGTKPILGRLVEGSDVLVHNMRPQAADRLGVDAGTVRRINPRIVHCTAVGYGSDGPLKNEPAYDDVMQARSGLAALLADDDGVPRLAPTILADKITGLYVAQAILAALYARQASGEGTTIEVPMFETMSSFILAEHMGGRIFDPPLGDAGYNRLLNPYRRPHRTADGYLVALPYSTKHWRSVFEMLGRDDWMTEAWVADPEQRTRRIDELYRFLGEVMPERTTAEWVAAFAAIDVPCAPVASIDDLYSDDQLAASGFFEPIEHPTEGNLVVTRHPVRYSEEQLMDRPVPALGAHTNEVLAEFGMSDAEIAASRSSGLVF